MDNKLEVARIFRKPVVFKLNVPNLSLIDEEFAFKVFSDIERFVEQYNSNSRHILLFPPFNPYRRFLIHETSEPFCKEYGLRSFSVGHESIRRIVICFGQMYLPSTPTSSSFRGTETQKHQGPSRTSDSTLPMQSKVRHSMSAGIMGIKKPNHESRFSKANELNVYRPPALRNEAAKLRNGNTLTDSEKVHAASKTSASLTTTTTTTTAGQQVAKSGQTANGDIKNPTMTLMSNIMKDDNNQPQANNSISNLTRNTSNATEESNSGSEICVKQQDVSLTRRKRRPDRAVYIPRARRSQTTPPTTTSNASNATITATTSSTTSTTTTPTIIQSQLSVGKLLSGRSDCASTMNGCVDVPNNMEETSTKPSVRGKMHSRKNKLIANKKSTSTTREIVAAANDSNENILINKNTKKKNNNNSNRNNGDYNVDDDVDVSSSSSSKAIKSNEICAMRKNNYDNLDDKLALPINYHNDNDNNVNIKSDCDKITLDVSNIYLNNKNCNNQNELIKSDNTRMMITTPIPPAPPVNAITSTTNQNNNVNQLTNCGGVRIEDLHIDDIKKPIKSEDIDEQELKRASKEINRSNRRIMKQTFASDVLEIPEKLPASSPSSSQSSSRTTKTDNICTQKANANGIDNSGGGSDDWDAMYNERGECLDPKIIEEITETLGEFKIHLPEMDYSMYLDKESLPHVLEVSNFPAEFKHQDLLMVFSQYKESGFDIKWVDDTHALAVFSSARIAAEVLAMGHPFVIVKPLSEATAESRLKAKKCATSLQPYRPRPATCAALARRLVTGALGVRLKTAAAEREDEKRLLKQAKEQKLLAAKQRDEIWDS